MKTMQVYLVRMIEDKTAYGIFWAKDPRDLFKTIDEKDDPGEFEFLVLEDRGGLFFGDGNAEWELGVKQNLPTLEEDDGEAVEKRLDETTRNLTFNETVNHMLCGRYEISGFVPWSKLGTRR